MLIDVRSTLNFKNITHLFLLTTLLGQSPVFACGDDLLHLHGQRNFSLNSSRDKQFVDDYRQYRSGVDLGFDQYKTESMNGTKTVALTFDDGPHPTRTPKVLDLLKRYNAKATFFILTEKINASTMPILRRIIAEGHILASHGSNHNNSNSMNEKEYYHNLRDSIESVEEVVKNFGGEQKGVYYRFPYGAYGKASNFHHFNTIRNVGNDVYGENCVNFAFWDIDSADWGPGLSAEQIADNVLAHVIGGTAYTVKTKRTIFGNTKYVTESYRIRTPRGGGVALLHDIHERSVEATEILLKKASQNNIKIVPLDQVKEFSYAGKNCQL